VEPSAGSAALHRELMRRTGLGADRLLPDLPLGPGGLDLDSVALVELLLECERLCGRELVATFLAHGVLTVGALEQAMTGEREPTST
jgi:hypothetical protein